MSYTEEDTVDYARITRVTFEAETEDGKTYVVEFKPDPIRTRASVAMYTTYHEHPESLYVISTPNRHAEFSLRGTIFPQPDGTILTITPRPEQPTTGLNIDTREANNTP